ncbi:MAG: transposase, partial [Methylobacterium sp.]|nr:transposase [Methylobacterium sp.]
MGERIGLSDEEWAIIGPLLPAERGRGCRPAQDNCRYFEGMMWLARTGAQGRHLPDEYGKWNSVFRRYRRWLEVGAFDFMLESLAEMVERDPTADMIASTIVRAHHCAVAIKRAIIYFPHHNRIGHDATSDNRRTEGFGCGHQSRVTLSDKANALSFAMTVGRAS